MTLNTFSFVSLIFTVLVILVIFILKILISKRTGVNCASALVGLVIYVLGVALSIVFKKLDLLLIFTPISLVMVLFQHFITLSAYGSSKEEDDNFSFANDENSTETEISADLSEATNEELLETDDSLLDVSRDFLIHAAKAFSEDSGLDKLLEYINASIIEETKADGGAILLLDDFDDIIAVKSFKGEFPPPYCIPADIPHKIVRVETNFRFAQFGLSDNIFGIVAKSGKAELITDPLNDSRMYQNEPEEFLRLGTYIFVPLKLKDTVIGVVSLARKFGSEPFTEAEFKAAKVLTSFASSAVNSVYAFHEIVEHSELTREAELACKLQKNLHPKLLPAIPSVTIGNYFNTAEGVCGDYYDVIPSRKDRISFVLADVAGKGMNSLMIMIMLRAILRLVVNTTQSAATILSWANRGISNESTIDHFASLALINYDSTTGKIQFATAGTTPVYIYSAETKEIKKVSSPSEPIGVEKTTQYVDNEADVKSGDIIVMYTDGLVETVNESGVPYTAGKLTQLIAQNSNLSGKEIANLVKSDIKKFSGSAHQHDDQTLLVIKIQ
ncbi:MAG: SpoIIE family protein phosphatase [Spirochaetaceae bacterium]|nr:SpoIIE family protein phosphatase [Treponema sp.]MBP3449933.1 SpoIIE family protein phosphatase [Spirochaetaceae bacterium]MBQ3024984.1 SpoIIE family protein phosphatase [Spirochaetaceae bacterium]